VLVCVLCILVEAAIMCGVPMRVVAACAVLLRACQCSRTRRSFVGHSQIAYGGIHRSEASSHAVTAVIASHRSPRLSDPLGGLQYGPPAQRASRIYAVGGAPTIGWMFRRRPSGMMIAGNSGRPGGNVGDVSGIGPDMTKVRADHTTQEEDLVSNWLLSTAVVNGVDPHRTFHAIEKRWGLNDFTKSAREDDYKTIQRVDYVHTKKSSDYALPAFVLKNAVMSRKDAGGFAKHAFFRSHLVFVAGPNVADIGTPRGTMRRTRNAKAGKDYTFFKECVGVALRTGIDALAAAGAKVILIARLSTGIYAGPYKKVFNQEFTTLLDRVLEEKVNGVPRFQLFDRVIEPMLLESLPNAARPGRHGDVTVLDNKHRHDKIRRVIRPARHFIGRWKHRFPLLRKIHTA